MKPLISTTIFLIVLYDFPSCFSLDGAPMLVKCIDSVSHKISPGPEDELHAQCDPWKQRACCTSNTSHAVHGGLMYNMNYDHCGGLSEKCVNHFKQDHCFYECEPNLGPWIVKVTQKYRNERAFEVPLCASDCLSWYDACKDDLTCAQNWPTELKTLNGRAQCPTGKDCKTFKEIYNNDPKSFCEKVWDHSWKYTPDTEPCMRIWFNGLKGNPNKQVAESRCKEIECQQWGAAAHSVSQTVVAFILTVLVTVFVCH